MATVKYPISVADVNSVMASTAAFDRVRVYRRTTRSGSDSLLGTVTLVADTYTYEYEDTSGVAGYWYSHSYYSTSTLAETEKTEPQPAGEQVLVTAQTLRRLVAKELGLFRLPEGDATFPGPSGTITAVSDADTFTIAAFAESIREASDTFKRSYLLVNDGNRAGQERWVASISASGVVELSRALTGSPSVNDTVDIYDLLPSREFDRALWGDAHGAFLDVWSAFQWPLSGAALASGEDPQREWLLPYWIEDPEQVIRVRRRQGDNEQGHILTAGQQYELVEREGGGVALYLAGGLSEDVTILIEGYRRPRPAQAATDAYVLGEQQQRLLVVQAAVRIMQDLITRPSASAREVGDWRNRLKLALADLIGLKAENGKWKELASPRRQPFVQVSPRGW